MNIETVSMSTESTPTNTEITVTNTEITVMNTETNADYHLPVANGEMRQAVEIEPAETSSGEESPKKCGQLLSCIHECTRPCMAETHPLPHNAGPCRRFLDSFLCPPHSRMGAVIFLVCFAATAWAALFSITGKEALPGGNLFSLLVLFLACWCGGYVVGMVHLPPLLGELFFFKNICCLHVFVFSPFCAFIHLSL